MVYAAYIVLAIFTGILTAFCRQCNGRLSLGLGPFKASLVNHIVGFLLISAFFLIWASPSWETVVGAPFHAYLGGVIGALYVAINSYVIFRMGILVSGLLVISGQMVTGVLLSAPGKSVVSILSSFAGIACIVGGVYLLNRAARKDNCQPSASSRTAEL